MERINKYIEQEKALSPSPNLENRILLQIKNSETRQVFVSKSIHMWQKVAVAASVAIIAVAGTMIGNTYKQPTSSNFEGLVVNDNYIEQLSIYTADENE